MRRLTLRVAGIALAAATAAGLVAPAAAEPSVAILPLAFEATEFRGPGSRIAQVAASAEAYRGERALAGQPLVVLWGKGGGAVVTLAGADLRVVRAGRGSPDLSALEGGRGAIPGARAEAEGPLSALLVEPTRDYPHEALGSPVHAKALALVERKPAKPGPEPRAVPTETSRIEAGPDAVWEDREPRLVDLAGSEGAPAVVVVRSYRDRGSALAVIGRKAGAWSVLAETPADGEPFRWLNPAAFPRVGGAQTIALVRRPHLDGLLQLWRWADGRLVLAAEKAGYSNHAFGQAAQALAAAFEQDGAARLAIPTLDRRALAILALAPDGIREIARAPLPARALTGVTALGRGRDLHLLVGLEDGRVADIRP